MQASRRRPCHRSPTRVLLPWTLIRFNCFSLSPLGKFLRFPSHCPRAIRFTPWNGIQTLIHETVKTLDHYQTATVMAEGELTDSLQGFKLCGFLRVVLAVARQAQTLPFCVPCSLFADGPNVGFRTADDILLLPVPEVNASREIERAEIPAWNGGGSSGADMKRRRRRLVGCMSIVQQLHALTVKKCVKIQARMLKVSLREFGNARTLVLVDVYLPIDVWSGWQFPNSGAVAASLFKHVRYAVFLFSFWRKMKIMSSVCSCCIYPFSSTLE